MTFSKLFYLAVLSGISFNTYTCISRAMIEEYENKTNDSKTQTTTMNSPKIKEQKTSSSKSQQSSKKHWSTGRSFNFHSEETM